MKRILLTLALAAAGLGTFAQAPAGLKPRAVSARAQIAGSPKRIDRLPTVQSEAAAAAKPVLGPVSAPKSVNITGPAPAYGATVGYSGWEIESWGGPHHNLQLTPDGGTSFIWQSGRTSPNNPTATGGRMVCYNARKPDGSFLYTGIATDATAYLWQVAGTTRNTTGVTYLTGRFGFPNLTSTATKEVITGYSIPVGLTRISAYSRPISGAGLANSGANKWTGLGGVAGTGNNSTLADTGSLESVFQHATSNSSTIHVVSTVSDGLSYPNFSDVGIADAVAYLRSDDNGATWTGTLMDTISAAHGYVGSKSASFDIDANGNNVAFVITTLTCRNNIGGVESNLFKSTDNGVTWKMRVIEKIDGSDTNNILPIDPTNPAGGFYAQANDGAYSVTLDNNGIAHVAVGRGYIPLACDGASDGNFYRNGLLNAPFGKIKYWNETYPNSVSPTAMSFIATPVDNDHNGVIDLGATAPGDFPHAATGFPTVSVDAQNNIYVLYHSPTEGSADANGAPLQDAFYVASRDGGATWSPELNYSGNFGNFNDGTGGTGTLEETWLAGLKHLGPDQSLQFTAFVDATSGCTYDFTGGAYAAAGTWLPNTLSYSTVSTHKVLNSFISAGFPSSLCGGNTFTVSYIAPDTLPVGSTLTVVLDTTAAHAFLPSASANWVTLGTTTIDATRKGTITYTVPAFASALTARIRVQSGGTLVSRGYETVVSGGAPGAVGAPTLNPSVSCVNNNSANTFASQVSNSNTATNFVWVVSPSNAYLNIGQNQNTATIYWNPAYTGPCTVSIVPRNGCGDGPLVSTVVYVSPNAALDGTISTATTSVTINNGSGTFNWYVNGTIDPSVTGATYDWSASTLGACVGQHGGTIAAEDHNAPGCRFIANILGDSTNTRPYISASGPTTFCTGGSVDLIAVSTVPATGWLWSNGATTQSITVSTSGTYFVQTVSAGCNSDTSTKVAVTVTAGLPVPSVYPSGSIVINTGECLTLYAPAGFQYLWSNGATTQNIQVCSTGTYSVKVIAGTCTSDASAGTSVALSTAASVTPEALGIYPNPAGGSFRIAGLANETRVRIFNSIGQVMSEEVVAPGASVNSAALPAGIYYVIVGSRSLKLVKE